METWKSNLSIHVNFLAMKLISLLYCCKKGVYPYEYMDDWEKFNETSPPEKEDFYSHLNMEDINDVDYTHAKWVCRYFHTKT